MAYLEKVVSSLCYYWEKNLIPIGPGGFGLRKIKDFPWNNLNQQQMMVSWGRHCVGLRKRLSFIPLLQTVWPRSRQYMSLCLHSSVPHGVMPQMSSTLFLSNPYFLISDRLPCFFPILISLEILISNPLLIFVFQTLWDRIALLASVCSLPKTTDPWSWSERL